MSSSPSERRPYLWYIQLAASLSGANIRVMTVFRADQDVANHAQRRRYPRLQDQQAWTREIDKVLVGVNSDTQLNEILQSVKKSESIDSFPINDINLLNPSLWKV